MCCEFVLEIYNYMCFVMSCRRKWEKISLTDRVKELHRFKVDMNILEKIKRREANWIGHILLSKCLLNTLLKERRRKLSEGKTRKKSQQLMEDDEEWREYYKLKDEALDRSLWRNGFGRGYGPVVRQTAEWITLYSKVMRWISYDLITKRIIITYYYERFSSDRTITKHVFL